VKTDLPQEIFPSGGRLAKDRRGRLFGAERSACNRSNQRDYSAHGRERKATPSCWTVIISTNSGIGAYPDG